jgi:WD40 repeat protein/energy-coupling factor transporter ATP-binding protein EcfA2
MDQSKALQDLLNGTATEEEIQLLKQGLVSGEISIGGNVNRAVIIIGNSNTVELTPEALDLLNARPLLGDLDRDLTGIEIAFGLERLESELPHRAPVLLDEFQIQARHLLPLLKTSSTSLSEQARKERVEALSVINNLCFEALDISFNALALGEEPPEYDSRSPFRGLESFRPEDSVFFFGREALTQRLVTKIRSHAFLAVLGASGSGKSSLVMAGLIPSLSLESIILRPGTDPLGVLESVKDKPLIVVDQFEELFTLTKDESTRKEFIAHFLALAKQNKVVITLRSDFLGDVAVYRVLSEEIQSHLEIIPPMNMDELHHAMEEQAKQVGLRFEADLSQQILDDVEGEPGAMPLLQHALWELWNRRHGRWLRASEYRAFGGVKQAITSTAENVFGTCTNVEQEQIRDIFLRLTRLDESDEGRDTRRRISLSDLISSSQVAASITLLLDKLATARLIVKNVIDGNIEIEVAHEALIRHWERLRNWLNEDRSNLRLRDDISDDARRWKNGGQDQSLLNHRGLRLEQAQLMSRNSRYYLNPTEQAYLEACEDLGKLEKAAALRRRRNTIAGVSVAVMLIMGILVGWGWTSSKSSQENALLANQNATAAIQNAQLAGRAGTSAAENVDIADTAQAIALTAQANEQIAKNAQATAESSAAYADSGALEALAISNLDTNYTLSMLFGLESFATLRHYNLTQGKEPDILVTLLQNAIPNLQEARPELGEVRQILFSPDGNLLATAGDSGIMLRETSDLQSIKDLERLSNQAVKAIAFSQDGSILATGGPDGMVTMWDVTTTTQIGTIPDNGNITSLSFSPDGKFLAVAGGDKIILWRLNGTGDYQRIKSISDGPITLVAFRPTNQGLVLVSGGSDGFFRFWDLSNPYEPVSVNTRNIYFVATSGIAFSGKYLALAWDNGDIQIYDCSNPQKLYGLSTIRTNQELESVAISADTQTLAAGGKGGLISLYDISDKQNPGSTTPLTSHTEQVRSITFHPESEYMASGGRDKATVLWNISQDPLSPLLRSIPFVGDVNIVAYSSSTYILALSDPEKKTYLWDLSDFNSPKELPYFYTKSVALNMAFNPNGSRIATFDQYNFVSVWDTTNLQTHPSLLHEFDREFVPFLAFGDDLIFVNPGSKGIFDISNKLSIKTRDFPVGAGICSNNVALTVSQDGSLLAIGNCGLNLWDITDQQAHFLANYTGLASNIESVAISSNKNLLATGHLDNSILLWDISQPGSPHIISSTAVGHTRSISSLAFSPDGRTLASGSIDRNIILWDISNPNSKLLFRATLERHTVPILPQALYFSSDGLSLVSASSKEVFVWNLDPEFWIEKACKLAGRNFTQSEWAQYLPGQTYRATCPNLPIEAVSTPIP